MRFSFALEILLTNGDTVRRSGWPAGAFLFVVPGSTITVESGRPLGDGAPHLVGSAVTYSRHIDLYDGQGALGPWVPSPADLVAEDWQLANEPG